MKAVRFEKGECSIEVSPSDENTVRIEVNDDDVAIIYLDCADARELAAYLIEMADKAEAGAL